MPNSHLLCPYDGTHHKGMERLNQTGWHPSESTAAEVGCSLLACEGCLSELASLADVSRKSVLLCIMLSNVYCTPLFYLCLAQELPGQCIMGPQKCSSCTLVCCILLSRAGSVQHTLATDSRHCISLISSLEIPGAVATTPCIAILADA